jgi:hypothetical protein
MMTFLKRRQHVTGVLGVIDEGEDLNHVVCPLEPFRLLFWVQWNFLKI